MKDDFSKKLAQLVCEQSPRGRLERYRQMAEDQGLELAELEDAQIFMDQGKWEEARVRLERAYLKLVKHEAAPHVLKSQKHIEKCREGAEASAKLRKAQVKSRNDKILKEYENLLKEEQRGSAVYILSKRFKLTTRQIRNIINRGE